MDHPRVNAFYFEWRGTKDNHAGMAYFAQCLRRELRFSFRCYRNVPRDESCINLAKYFARFMLPWTDSIFFMEYLTPIGLANQESVALNLRQKGVKKPIVGLVHLPEGMLLKSWKMDYIRSALDAIDHIIVYGSSLEKFFERIGYGNKVKKTFHYVDVDYYHPLVQRKYSQDKFTVITVGSLLRNVKLLKEIVQQCPDVMFEICCGINDLKPIFGGYPNVILHSYLAEDDLLLRMQHADASLSVMEDTIGSNAIVAGLACGLPQIVSDVGSIRDYCSDDNAIFCREPGDYLKAIRFLSQNREVCLKMGGNARKRAEEFSLSKSIDWFRDFFVNKIQLNHER